jgi:predicted nucleotidyltransferase
VPVATLLQQLHQRDAELRETDRRAVLERLHGVLQELLRGEVVWVLGSLAQAGRFGPYADIDLALERIPPRFSEYWLQGELEHRLGRRVDILLLTESRLRTKIEREGLRWML